MAWHAPPPLGKAGRPLGLRNPPVPTSPALGLQHTHYHTRLCHRGAGEQTQILKQGEDFERSYRPSPRLDILNVNPILLAIIQHPLTPLHPNVINQDVRVPLQTSVQAGILPIPELLSV